jgi:hypothetical protein
MLSLLFSYQLVKSLISDTPQQKYTKFVFKQNWYSSIMLPTLQTS